MHFFEYKTFFPVFEERKEMFEGKEEESTINSNKEVRDVGTRLPKEKSGPWGRGSESWFREVAPYHRSHGEAIELGRKKPVRQTLLCRRIYGLKKSERVSTLSVMYWSCLSRRWASGRPFSFCDPADRPELASPDLGSETNQPPIIPLASTNGASRWNVHDLCTRERHPAAPFQSRDTHRGFTRVS